MRKTLPGKEKTVSAIDPLPGGLTDCRRGRLPTSSGTAPANARSCIWSAGVFCVSPSTPGDGTAKAHGFRSGFSSRSTTSPRAGQILPCGTAWTRPDNGGGDLVGATEPRFPGLDRPTPSERFSSFRQEKEGNATPGRCDLAHSSTSLSRLRR